MVTEEKSAAVAELERLGFKFREDSQFDLELLSPDRRVQVREPKHYAPKENVLAYAIHMENGARFPAIVVTEDNWIVDGNTRVGASLHRKQKRFPAIIVDVQWETASETKRDELRLVAAGLNDQNGQRLTRSESRAVIAAALRRGLKQEHIARYLGVNSATIGAVRRELQATQKMERVGLRPDNNGASFESAAKAVFGGVPLRALGGKPVQDLNDEPFKELALYAKDAGLSTKEVEDLGKELKELASDRAQLDRIVELRVENDERIRQVDLEGGKGKPPVSSQLRQRLGFILEDTRTITLMVERNSDNWTMHADAIKRTIAKLQAVLAEQERLS